MRPSLVLLPLATAILIAGCCCDNVLEKAMEKGYEVLYCDSDVKTTGKAGAAVEPGHVTGEGEFTVTSGHRFRLLKKQTPGTTVSGAGGIAVETSSSTSVVRTSLSVNDRAIKLVSDKATAEKLGAQHSGQWQVLRTAQPIQLGGTAPGTDTTIDFSYELIDPRPLPATGTPMPEISENRLGFLLEGDEWVIFPGGNRVRGMPNTLLSLTAPSGQTEVNWAVQKGSLVSPSLVFLKNTVNQTSKVTLLAELYTVGGKKVLSKTMATLTLKKYELKKIPGVTIPTQDLEPQSYLLKIQVMRGETVDDVQRIGLHVIP